MRQEASQRYSGVVEPHKGSPRAFAFPRAPVGIGEPSSTAAGPVSGNASGVAVRVPRGAKPGDTLDEQMCRRRMRQQELMQSMQHLKAQERENLSLAEELKAPRFSTTRGHKSPSSQQPAPGARSPEVVREGKSPVQSPGAKNSSSVPTKAARAPPPPHTASPEHLRARLRAQGAWGPKTTHRSTRSNASEHAGIVSERSQGEASPPTHELEGDHEGLTGTQCPPRSRQAQSVAAQELANDLENDWAEFLSLSQSRSNHNSSEEPQSSPEPQAHTPEPARRPSWQLDEPPDDLDAEEKVFGWAHVDQLGTRTDHEKHSEQGSGKAQQVVKSSKAKSPLEATPSTALKGCNPFQKHKPTKRPVRQPSPTRMSPVDLILQQRNHQQRQTDSREFGKGKQIEGLVSERSRGAATVSKANNELEGQCGGWTGSATKQRINDPRQAQSVAGGLDKPIAVERDEAVEVESSQLAKTGCDEREAETGPASGVPAKPNSPFQKHKPAKRPVRQPSPPQMSRRDVDSIGDPALKRKGDDECDGDLAAQEEAEDSRCALEDSEATAATVGSASSTEQLKDKERLDSKETAAVATCEDPQIRQNPVTKAAVQSDAPFDVQRGGNEPETNDASCEARAVEGGALQGQELQEAYDEQKKELAVLQRLLELRREDLEQTIEESEGLEIELEETEQTLHTFSLKVVAYVLSRWLNALTYRLLRNWKFGALLKDLELARHLLELRREELEQSIEDSETLETELATTEQVFGLKIMAYVVYRWMNAQMSQGIRVWNMRAVLQANRDDSVSIGRPLEASSCSERSELQEAYDAQAKELEVASTILELRREELEQSLEESETLETELTATEQSFGLRIMSHVVYRWMNAQMFLSLRNWKIGSVRKELEVAQELLKLRRDELEETLEASEVLETELTVTEQSFGMKMLFNVFQKVFYTLTLRALRNWKVGAVSVA